MFSAWPEKIFNVSCDCGRDRWCFETAKCLYFYYVGVASVEFEVLFFFLPSLERPRRYTCTFSSSQRSCQKKHEIHPDDCVVQSRQVTELQLHKCLNFQRKDLFF